MNILVAIAGWIIVGVGVLGIVRPHLMLDLILGWPSDIRFYVAVTTRIVLGLLFIFVARSCRLPRFVLAIGIIALAAGIVIALLGAGRVDLMVQWMSGQSSTSIRLLYMATTVFGVLLAYSGVRRQ